MSPSRSSAAVLALVAALPTPTLAATPAEMARACEAHGRAAGDATRGKALFNYRHGGEWSCASCHGNAPTQAGRHAATGKVIAPLAPGLDPERFTDSAKVEKWFTRNCGDILGRECSAAEKADVLAYLTSLKP